MRHNHDRFQEGNGSSASSFAEVILEWLLDVYAIMPRNNNMVLCVNVGAGPK